MKQGAENMIAVYKGSSSREKKLVAEAQQMLSDSKRKIDFIRMEILKIEQQKPDASQFEESKIQFKNVSLFVVIIVDICPALV